MDAVLAFVPEEQRVQYSAMTGQLLFYMGDTDLQNKVLAIVEEGGAQRASYALKLLQSEGEGSIASTGKDPVSGRHVTHEYRVKGPVMLFLTTTAIDIDEELLNRCLVLTVNEDRAQTQAIQRIQRKSQTIEGLLRRRDREELLRLPGIAAGIRGRVKIGDVIVGDPCWDWGSGKWKTIDGGGSELAVAPHQLPLHSALKFKFERMAGDRGFVDRIRNDWPAQKPSEAADIVIGPVASGAAVLRDARQLDNVEKQHRKVCGVDMEAYGVYGACMDARLPQPRAVAIKSVCDFADSSKNDDYQSYAAYMSAQILRAFLESA